MIYLKTYFYTPHEVKFLRANLEESYEHIDKFIICESDIHHTGMPRDLIFESQDILKELPNSLRDKIIYLPCYLQDQARDAYNNESAIHHVNEPLMRSTFMNLLDFEDNDIIFSVDADEILYKSSYPILIEEVKRHKCIKINLNQFFYKFNYLWRDKDFCSPVAAQYSRFKGRFPCNWRDEGRLASGRHGAHFSWCMSPEEMLFKLDTYSHPRYRKFADINVLRHAIETKTYPFDPHTSFHLETLSRDDARIPSYLRSFVQ